MASIPRIPLGTPSDRPVNPRQVPVCGLELSNTGFISFPVCPHFLSLVSTSSHYTPLSRGYCLLRSLSVCVDCRSLEVSCQWWGRRGGSWRSSENLQPQYSAGRQAVARQLNCHSSSTNMATPFPMVPGTSVCHWGLSGRNNVVVEV